MRPGANLCNRTVISSAVQALKTSEPRHKLCRGSRVWGNGDEFRTCIVTIVRRQIYGVRFTATAYRRPAVKSSTHLPVCVTFHQMARPSPSIFFTTRSFDRYAQASSFCPVRMFNNNVVGHARAALQSLDAMPISPQQTILDSRTPHAKKKS